MDYLVICLVALVVSALTLFSGFGLGTLLMPAFALFFPINFAVASTAIVHLANNLFKVLLVGRHADVKTVLRFTIPAVIFAAIGAFLLGFLSDLPSLVEYRLGSKHCEITWIKLVMSVLIGFFSLWDLIPRFQGLVFGPKYVPLGGALSGFFGGLSGLQGALRSAFLIRLGLSKEAFIGTGAVSTVAVDTSRLIVYGSTFVSKDLDVLAANESSAIIIAGILSAFVGSFIGKKLMKKVTISMVQLIVGVMLFCIALAMGTGLI